MHVELSADEALVLFDLLNRWQDTNRWEISDEADLLAVLERHLAEPFRPDYEQLVSAAKARIRTAV